MALPINSIDQMELFILQNFPYSVHLHQCECPKVDVLCIVCDTTL